MKFLWTNFAIPNFDYFKPSLLQYKSFLRILVSSLNSCKHFKSSSILKSILKFKRSPGELHHNYTWWIIHEFQGVSTSKEMTKKPIGVDEKVAHPWVSLWPKNKKKQVNLHNTKWINKWNQQWFLSFIFCHLIAFFLIQFKTYVSRIILFLFFL